MLALEIVPINCPFRIKCVAERKGGITSDELRFIMSGTFHYLMAVSASVVEFEIVKKQRGFRELLQASKDRSAERASGRRGYVEGYASGTHSCRATICDGDALVE